LFVLVVNTRLLKTAKTHWMSKIRFTCPRLYITNLRSARLALPTQPVYYLMQWRANIPRCEIVRVYCIANYTSMWRKTVRH